MSFHPPTIREIQRLYFSTIETQLAASVAVVIAFVGIVWAVHRGKEKLADRYSTYLAELLELGVSLVALLSITFALTVVWNVTFVLGFVVETAVVDRWTAMWIVTSVIVFFVGYLLIRAVNRSIDRLSETGAITEHQSEAFYHVADVGIFVVALLIVLSVWGVDLTNVFLGAGLISAVVGLAARETLAAIIAGFVLLFSRPFRVGDWIEVNEKSGIVTDITMFNTEIRTFSSEHALIPNDEVTNNTLVNYSRNERLRIELEVGVDYDTDLDHARATAERAMSETDRVLDVPEPDVVLKRFADSSIVLELRFWIENPTQQRRLEARTAVIQSIKRAFDREDIAIPFPQREHSTRESGDASVSAPTEQFDRED